MTRLEKALHITSKFEGGSYDNLAGNFDGMGISAGILQWNFGTGSLQQLLKMYGAIPKGTFPLDVNPLKDMSPPDAVHFSMKMQQYGRVLPEWKKAWKKFLVKPEVVKIQKELASEKGDWAERVMKRWHFDSSRAYCFFFDIRVQNGWMKRVEKPAVDMDRFFRVVHHAEEEDKEVWGQRVPSREQIILFLAGWDRSRKSHPRWRSDVFKRKSCIAMGKGVVHGKAWDFSQLLVR